MTAERKRATLNKPGYLPLHSWMKMRSTIDRIGKYELKAVLARTPQSTVYDGWDSDIARRVAVKLMPLSLGDDSEASEAFARFKRGAQAAGQLNHPNIVGVYDYGETADYAYLVMEFVNGPTLKALFDENQRFSLSDICRIIGSVLEALQFSHDRGVVHRDVKPANIMFTSDNQVKITDFGIARLEDSEMTQAGMVIGTPAYMSPEQFLGEKIDLRTDIYSTGVVLYHILTGERPYEGNLATIMHKVLYGTPLLPSKVSTLVTTALDTVVTRAMARNREDRYNSAAEFNAALQAVLVPVAPRPERFAGGTARPPGKQRPSTSGASGPSARTIGFVGMAACVLVAGGALGWYGLHKPESPPTGQPPALPVAVQPQPPQDQAQLEREQEEIRLQKQEQARIQQEQARALEQQRLQQAQEQARIQQEQEQARLQQEQQEQARLQQLARDQAREKQRQDIARQQQQDLARQQQLARDQARQKQEQDQARQKQEQDQARQKQEQDQARQKLALAQDQARPKPLQEQKGPKPEQDNSTGTLPDPYPVTSISGVAGLVCESITADSASQFGLDNPQGMVVTGVVTGGPAFKAGIHDRDVILKIKGAEAHNLSVLNKIAADTPAGQTVPLDILSHGNHKVVELLFSQASQ
jgi:serine/threonine-protein kinase